MSQEHAFDQFVGVDVAKLICHLNTNRVTMNIARETCILFVAVSTFLIVDFCAAQQTNSVANALENGIYLIHRWTIDKTDLFPLLEDEVFIRYDESKFLQLQDENEQPPVKYLALSKTNSIGFQLGEKPNAIRRDDGRLDVGLVFSAEMSGKMKDFSRQYLGRQVATVIGGEVLTLHKIRSIIDGGQLQITRCTDRGCELIFSRLAEPDGHTRDSK